jgi:putative transcriptional regulator
MTKRPDKDLTSQSDITGQFLIAMPGMSDPRFDRSVIYICSHSRSGAMGLIINKPVEDLSFEEVLHQLVNDVAALKASRPVRSQIVYHGGPVEQGRGLVLHSTDYKAETSHEVSPGISLTSSIEVLKDIVEGSGPDKTLLALGYAGWSAGQLEAEIAANGWLTCAASPDIVFDDDCKTKYTRALAQLGIDPALLSASAGHA